MERGSRRPIGLLCWLALILGGGCDQAAEPQPPSEVVVYAALDRQFSEPILQTFSERTGIKVRPVYDAESTKTVGLTNRIRAEAHRPRCDVFWNNEILNTLRLKEEGLLQPCDPAEAVNYPAQYRDSEKCWFGFAARARVVIVNTDLVPTEQTPTTLAELTKEPWRGRVGIAKPLFGTTASHVACLYARLGEVKARELLGALKANGVQILAGNKTCAEAVGAGRLAAALTDTDDAIIEIEAGRPVRMVFHDSFGDGIGVLLLPNTLALVKGAPNRESAVKLINYLLSAEIEERLAEGPSAQIPLHSQARKHSRAARLADLRVMEVDFASAARAFPTAAQFIEAEFLK